MKKLLSIFIILSFMFTTLAFADTFIERTDGKITGAFARSQYEGQERMKDDVGELLLFRNPPKTEKQINDEKIKKRIRKLAIDSLKGDNGLPSDYEDK